MKHTKGKWEVRKNGLNRKILIYSNKEKIAICNHKIQDKTSLKETEANAKLIASAPDLLEALNRCLNCLTMDSDMEEDFAPEIKKAKQAIKKATK